ncbi:MAG TPA: paraquat-inducible protein A [Opitutaceae bacterium]|nr:paraquat-inducible protein A [Opitutaceae bacterium]
MAPGDRAVCARCDTVLASRPRLGPDAPVAFALTGLLLAPPAMLLPFVSAAKLGHDRAALLFTGVEALWDQGMHLLAIWVCLCGGAVPAALLVTLAGLLLPPRLGRQPLRPRMLWQAAHAFGHWAMPEVQVLAVLVALMKLGKLVDVAIGPGFWCYVAMTLALLCAWHSFEVTFANTPPEETADVPASPS